MQTSAMRADVSSYFILGFPNGSVMEYVSHNSGILREVNSSAYV